MAFRALLSVSDKTGIVEFARGLAARGVELISTDGTGKALREAGLVVTDAGALTGYGEFLDGRVKTLHPSIHGGILAKRSDEKHRAEMAEREIATIDLVAVNLYPFADTVASGASPDDCVEMIDIGGPAMVRAAAKNFADVAVVTDPADYSAVLEALGNGRTIDLDLKRRLAGKAYAHTASYDAAVASWFQEQEATDDPNQAALPETLLLAARRTELCRYGENPHQAAAIYRLPGTNAGIVGGNLIQGKALSYNNVADADAAWALASDFAEPTVAIIKHANPCGVATAGDLVAAHTLAVACDPTSAFGGIVAANREIDAAAAETIVQLFTEVVIAPGFTGDALAMFAQKRDLRVLTVTDNLTGARVVRSVSGGLLVQTPDLARPLAADMKAVTRRTPTAAEMTDLLFAQTVCKHVKSNAIVLARGMAAVGIGAGQMSRVDSVRIAARKGSEGPGTKPCVVASDAFFPFPDGLEAASAAGATAAIQPGGSKRDDAVIAAADRMGMAMVFTGTRHFRH